MCKPKTPKAPKPIEPFKAPDAAPTGRQTGSAARAAAAGQSTVRSGLLSSPNTSRRSLFG